MAEETKKAGNDAGEIMASQNLAKMEQPHQQRISAVVGR